MISDLCSPVLLSLLEHILTGVPLMHASDFGVDNLLMMLISQSSLSRSCGNVGSLACVLQINQIWTWG